MDLLRPELKLAWQADGGIGDAGRQNIERSRGEAPLEMQILELELSLAGQTGQHFFEQAVAGLSALTGAGAMIIGSFETGIGEVQTLAASDGTLGTKYSLPDPILHHLKSGTSAFLEIHDLESHGVSDARLNELKVRSYIACVLRDSSGDPIGIVEGLFREPIANLPLTKSAFRILSVRIALELYRLKADERLRELEERYAFALRAGDFGVYEWNSHTQKAVFNSRYYQIIGHPEDTRLDFSKWISLLHPDDYEKVSVGMQKEMQHHKVYHSPVNLRIRNSEGAYKWIQHQSYSTSCDGQHGARRSVGMVRNIDEEIKAEARIQEGARQQELLNQQLKEREERYSFALKVGNLGVYDWYPNEGRTIFSPVLADIMGAKTEEFNLSYASWLERVHPEDRDVVRLEDYKWGQNSRSDKPSIYRFLNAAGEYRWLEAHDMAVVVDDNGHIKRIIGIVKDIDESKRAADMLTNSLEQQKLLNIELSKREQALTETQHQLISQMSVLKDLNRELGESEARWAYALEGNGDGVVEWDIVADDVFFSARAKEILGFGLTNNERQNFLTRIHPDSREDFRQAFLRSLQPPFDPFQMEVQISDDRKIYRWVMFRGKVVETSAGQPLKMVGTLTDLSQLKLFQKEFTIYEQLIKQSQSIILFATLDGTIEFINATGISMLEYRQHEIIGQNISTLIGEIEIRRIMTEDFRDQLSFYTRSGNRIVTEVTSSLIHHDGFEIGYVFNAIDITEKRALEEKIGALTLAKFEAELEGQRKKTEMVIEVQENEKERIARELHDGVGQLLSLAKLNIEEIDSTLTPAQRNGFRNLKEIIQHISTDIKGLTHQLMPLSIRNLGLESALKELLERYRDVKEGKMDITCKIHLNGYDPDPKLAIHIYRTAQEGINNSIKYSGATCVSLMCVKLKNSINLIIEDNGKGFDLDVELSKKDAFGLKTMNERARLINGKLQINTAIASGTTISLTIPLH